MIATLLVCLVLAAFTAEASLYAGPGLYNNYQGEYAAAYDNYIPKPYAFEYGVSDPHTGDHKNQWETKDEAGVVRGSYSLLEPDGSTRIVDYIADDNGFRAVVKKIGLHGQSVETHGGPVLEAPLISPIVVAEQGSIPVEPVEIAEPAPIRINYQTPLPVEAAPLYHSYDGGLEHYQNLYNTQPLPFNVPQGIPQGAYVELPRQFGGYAQQPLEQPTGPLFAPSYPQGPIQGPPQGIISSKLDDLEPQYGAPPSGGYPVPQYQPQPVAPQTYQGPETVQGALPVDDYSLELAYGQPNGLGAPKLFLGNPASNSYVPRAEAVAPNSYAPPVDNGLRPNSYSSSIDNGLGPNSYSSSVGNGLGPNSYSSSVDNGLGPRASYDFVQQYGPDGTGDIRLNQGEYLPPSYGRQATEHK